MFYKDGYTDLRGVFDFESLSVDASSEVNLYSILVISENNGTTIVEARNRKEATEKLQAMMVQLPTEQKEGYEKKKKLWRAKAFYA